MRDRVLRLLLVPRITAPLAPVVRDRATVFFLHRFAIPELGVRGHDPARLRAWLGWLRRERYELVSIEEIFRRLAEGQPFRHTVAFTLDDGYFDQATVAAPLFAEFDCPVTTFVATGFLDRKLWMWWDRLEYALVHSSRHDLVARLRETEVPLTWKDDQERALVLGDLTELVKRIPDAEKHAAIADLARQAEVELPNDPPATVAPMTWLELREAERLGMTFGPHTVTHPILSQTDDVQSKHELAESWRRLREETAGAVPIFCYPNGTFADFGEREVRTLGELGLCGAVLGVAGYADRPRYLSESAGRFRVHRFSYDERLPFNVQYASGVERLKELVRGEGRT